MSSKPWAPSYYQTEPNFPHHAKEWTGKGGGGEAQNNSGVTVGFLGWTKPKGCTGTRAAIKEGYHMHACIEYSYDIK